MSVVTAITVDVSSLEGSEKREINEGTGMTDVSLDSRSTKVISPEDEEYDM